MGGGSSKNDNGRDAKKAIKTAARLGAVGSSFASWAVGAPVIIPGSIPDAAVEGSYYAGKGSAFAAKKAYGSCFTNDKGTREKLNTGFGKGKR